MSNPFIFEKLAMGKDFCGRKDEILLLKQRCKDHTNTLLFGRRRYGKSSLINEFFRSLPERQYLKIYVDLFDIVSATDFARLLYTASTKAMPLSINHLIRNISTYFSKATFDISVSASGSPKITPTLGARDFEEFVADALDGITAFAKERNLKVVIALDEFQQIALVKDKKIDAILRKYMQSNPNLCFIFSGSKRHMLSTLFHHQSSPLYKMAAGLELTGIEAGAFHAFANKRMNADLPRDVFDYLYQQADGESKLIQQICYHLHMQDKKTLSNEDVDAAVNRILDEDDGIYRMLVGGLTANQRLALRLVSRNEGKELFAAPTLLQAGITKQSLYTSLTSLRKNEIVDRENEQYFIPDRGLELWLRRDRV